jgi:hypothetical protein
VLITFNGEPLCNVYPHATKWQVLKYRFFRGIRWVGIRTLIIAGVTGLFFTTYKIGQHNPDVSFTREISTVVVPQVFAGETMEGKVDELKEKLLDEMVACENPTHVLVNPDDNRAGTLPLKDKVSIGDLQYKISTMQHHHKTLYGTNISDREALMLGLDTPRARALAMDAWLNIKGSINAWTCANESMKTQVELIRFLTK